MHSSITEATDNYIGIFLKDLFDKFERENIDYAVGREYEFLPDSLEGRDLDIHVEKGELERAYSAVEAVADCYSAVVLKIRQEFGLWLLVIHPHSPIWGLRIDIAYPDSHTWRGICYIDLDCAMKRKVFEKGMRRLRKEDIVFMQFCRDLVGRLQLRRKYHTPVREIYRADPESFERKLREIFGKRYARQLSAECMEGNFARLSQYGRGMRRVIILRNLAREPMSSTKKILRYLAYRCREYFKPSGVMVAVMGADGSGKSTLIELVTRDLENILLFRTLTYHARPNLLPSLGSLLLGRIEDGTPVTNPHGKKPSGVIGSMIRLAYYTLDYFVGYWVRVRPYLGRKCIAVIFDRYFYDYYLDPIRWRITLPRWIIRIFEAFVFKPDIVFFLSADPNVIHNRKAELSPEEIKKQMYESRKLIDRVKNSVLIDTSGSIVRSQEEMLSAILWAIERRLKSRED